MSNPFSLTGKIALVNGASRGIGLAIARGVAAAGANTILAARSIDRLEQHAQELRSEGFQASALKLDMADNVSIEAGAVAAGEVDILINVAGTNIRKRIELYTAQEYEMIMQTNLHGIFRLTQLIGPAM